MLPVAFRLSSAPRADRIVSATSNLRHDGTNGLEHQKHVRQITAAQEFNTRVLGWFTSHDGGHAAIDLLLESAKTTTTNAPVGPPICVEDPPRAEIAKPATIAQYRPV